MKMDFKTRMKEMHLKFNIHDNFYQTSQDDLPSENFYSYPVSTGYLQVYGEVHRVVANYSLNSFLEANSSWTYSSVCPKGWQSW